MRTSKTVMVTGGGGFLGRHVVERFRTRGYEVSVPRSRDYDLRTVDGTRAAFADFAPDIVVHAAADVGGIGYNQICPADIFTNNVRMACNVMEAAKDAGIEKLVHVGSACAYPGDVAGSMSEDSFLDGPMHPSVEVYGFSKRALFLGARAYRQQYGLRSIFLLLTNLYGPWDKYDPKDSHVVAAMVRRFVEAVDEGVQEVVCWGTGTPVREFMYVEDCAEAIVLCTEKYDAEGPLNIGTGIGTTISELAEASAEAAGYRGAIKWDPSRPDGAMRKVLDVSRMEEAIGRPGRAAPLREGLAATVAWYRENAATLAR